jgi:hypothetical protein
MELFIENLIYYYIMLWGVIFIISDRYCPTNPTEKNNKEWVGSSGYVVFIFILLINILKWVL